MAVEYPNVLNDANVYVDGKQWLGAAEVNLPEINHKVLDFNIFGVAGGMEVPLIGHIDKMKLTIKFKSIDKDVFGKLVNSAKAPLLDIRAAVQKYNPVVGQMKFFPVKVIAKGFFYKVKWPAFKQGSDDTADAEFEVHYLKVEVDGKEVLEIDKFNYIYRIEDRDLLAEVRSALGA